MSLEFADFAHYYAGSGLSEEAQRENFEVYASILESLVQHFWNEEAEGNALGIDFDLATIPDSGELTCEASAKTEFNCAACLGFARKKET